VFHVKVIICAAWPGLSVIVFCATVTLLPVPLLTSIVMVRFTGEVPELVTETVMLTDSPAVTDWVEMVAAASWTEDWGEVMMSVTMVEWLMPLDVAVTLIA